jgi:hypothetical protein
MKNLNEKRDYKFDMSPEVIDRRLRELGQLYKLGVAIQKAKHIGKVKDFIQQENGIETHSQITILPNNTITKLPNQEDNIDKTGS